MPRPRITLVSLRVYKLIYLATPFTKYQAGLQKAFEDAAKLCGRLIRNGIRVYSPIAHGYPVAMYGELNPLDTSLFLPLNEDMAKPSQALAIGELEGWQDSEGIDDEIEIFEREQKPIYLIDPNSLVIRVYNEN